MQCASRLVVGLPVVLATFLVGLTTPLSAAEPARRAVGESATTSGRLLGVVTDAAGAPLEEVLISATGPTGAALAVCDADGRFEFRALPPGTYLLRAHIAGFASPRRHVVEVKSDAATVHAVTLHRAATAESAPAFLAAGFGALPGTAVTGSETETVTGAQPDQGDLRGSLDVDRVERRRVAPHDDSDKAWWLRRARRSILKDSGFDVRTVATLDEPSDRFDGFNPRMSAAGVRAGDPSTGFPLSGQLNFLTRATLDSRSELSTTDILPGQVAYVSLGGPHQASRWELQGAVRTGDAGTFVVAGSYVPETSSTHALSLGTSFSRQRLQSPFDVEALLTSVDGPVPDPSREVGSVSAEGSWAVVPQLTFDYGVSVARYGYLEDSQLLSPHAVFTMKPLEKTRVRLVVSQYMLAPGAEEFLPPSDGVWLPPERTFAPLSPGEPLRAERSQHFEAAVERDFGHTGTVGVRRFNQDVAEQMVTLFGVRPNLPSTSSNYYLTRAAGVRSEGWGLMVSHVIAGRVRGTVDYRLTHAEWAPWTAGGLSPQTVGVFRYGRERFHDVTTRVETEIPETATRVLVLYRISTAFAVVDDSGDALTSGTDGRFALRVNQTLPFSPIEGSRWEVLVDVRSLFREQVAGASVYDELLVVNPPKQVMGGLVVHF